ncbi:hypothetical protein CBR_g20258 [Chara braunii]|uniref:Reverse transcriptase domain-containing protein n=1 Tax=Chara braunii TaxID=69332 RepID=A0A388L034_CHABU|nr:hypothetical protein CBR_g20258 [Chara braunii]|eukprot:GBG75628.1 hypothetical protein CBR_g20258 [Chara braunii]
MDDYPMYGLLVGFSLWGTLWRLLFPLGFWPTFTCRVGTRGGTSTQPYTKEEEEKMVAVLRERKEKKEAKKKALQEEQAAKLKKIQEEMAREKERLKKEEEEKLKEVEEEKEEDETPLQKKRVQYSGSRDDEMEKHVIKRQVLEDEKRMEWKLAVMREKKRRVDAAAEAAEELEEVQKIEEQLAAQTELPKKMEVIAKNVACLARIQAEQYDFSRSQHIAVRSIRLGFRDFARELVGAVGAEVGHRLDKTERFCAGAIEGAKAAAPKEEEARPPRREPVKVKFPDSYSGKREENFDNWEANVKTYVHLQQVSPDQHVLIAIHALRDEAASFARSLVRAGNCNDDAVAYSSFTPLVDFLKLLHERFADVARSVFPPRERWESGEGPPLPDSPRRRQPPIDIVMGMDWGEAVGATLHLKEHECRLPSSSGEAKTVCLFHVSGVENPLVHCCLSAPAFARLVKKEKLEEQVFVAYLRPVTKPTEEKPMDPTIAKLLEEFKDVTEPPIGVVPWPIQHRIEIEPGSRTPKGAVYRMSPRELEELRKQLDELLEKGWIRPSSSPFGAPVLFVPKKEGEPRMCIDYRGLNAITVKNAEPLPRIDDLLDRVQGAKYFSKIDLKSGYHQIEVHPDDQYKTTFRTRYGHYEFIVMPFGLTNAPTTFQRCMNDLFRPWLDRFVVVYLDDILVFSKTLEEHQGHLRQVLEKLREANFKINAKKCDWAKTQVLYLGHVLDGDGVKLEDCKIAEIRDWPTPRTLTELHLFLGLAKYYRKFVRNFSTIVAPLRRLLRKETIWKWDKDCTSAMKKLKQALIEYPVLKVADPSLPFVVTTDASQYGIGVVLQQDDGNGYRPVEFMSARMPSEKVATSTYERELYDLRQALEHWKHYLLGRHFKVYFDHETLRWLKTQAKMTPKLTSCVTTVVIIMTSAIMSSLSFGRTRKAVIASLIFFRFWLGFGIGGDFPVATSIMSESFNQRNRGGFMAATFAMQGLGILSAATFAMVVAASFEKIYGSPASPRQKIWYTPAEADFAWRVILAFGAVPAALTLWLRLKMSNLLKGPSVLCVHSASPSDELRKIQVLKTKFVIEAGNVKVQKSKPNAMYSRKFMCKYGIKLFACAGTRFLLAFVFYSQILYMKDIFDAVGWLPDPKEMSGFMEMKSIARAQAIMTAVAIIPGYWVTAATIDCIGRYAVQVQGFFFMTVISIILVATFEWFMENKHNGGFLICFGLELFFINFGPNVTTFIFPAEIFPGAYRTQCHAITSAAGKIGGVLGVFLFVAFLKNKPDAGVPLSQLKATLGFLAAANSLGFVISLFFPETKDLPLESIFDEGGYLASSRPLDTDKLSSLAKGAKLNPPKSMSPVHAIMSNVTFSDQLESSKTSPLQNVREKVDHNSGLSPTMKLLSTPSTTPLPPLPTSLDRMPAPSRGISIQ